MLSKWVGVSFCERADVWPFNTQPPQLLHVTFICYHPCTLFSVHVRCSGGVLAPIASWCMWMAWRAAWRAAPWNDLNLSQLLEYPESLLHVAGIMGRKSLWPGCATYWYMTLRSLYDMLTSMNRSPCFQSEPIVVGSIFSVWSYFKSFDNSIHFR